ncbi:proline rich transmembrane protein 1B [Chanos chanos]|uniref:Proline rich transmembrane protein 1B n=1 Tax=Chanos chanos TaxID=29144 RepID=A0A6J2W0M1_CHACN|nr:proline rich transmembrane protein 1B-like [Chanos chanos]
MDPNKSSSAPPPGWNPDEKSAMGQPAPPPYQDYQQGVYPAAYPPPQPYGGAAHPPTQPYGGAPYGQPYPQGQVPPGQYSQPAVMVQPTVYVARGPLPNPLPDYLGYSIFTMLCCCLPLGIAALIYSISTRDANNQGNQQQAERSSRLARNLNHAALGIGITLVVLWIILVTVARN